MTNSRRARVVRAGRNTTGSVMSSAAAADAARSAADDLVRRLNASPADVAALLESLAVGTPVELESQHRSLTPGEERELREAGSLEAVMPTLSERASTRTAVADRSLVQDSLTVSEAAALLLVTASRVRQRLSSRTLFGVSTPAGWRLPRFQFTEAGELPGFATVLAALPVDVHPVALDSFLRRPQPDLVIDDEAVSPRDWLGGGGDPGAAARVAAGVYRLP